MRGIDGKRRQHGENVQKEMILQPFALGLGAILLLAWFLQGFKPKGLKGSNLILQMIEKRGAARDHPALLGVPETRYLKCLILRAI